jgi:chorismate dehydratase
MLRIAAIEFLNAAPLMAGLERDARFTLHHTLPSACADALRAGTADLGVIPAIELARAGEAGGEMAGVGGIGVASRDGDGEQAEVRSILLISRRPPEEARTVALDRASRTSAALAQILLRRRYGAACTAVAGDADWKRGLERADAVLLIGDPALQVRVRGEARGCHVLDLARVWREWTGLPFVFALWGIRRAALAPHQAWLPQRLQQALEEGWARRRELARAWAPRLDLPEAEVLRYLEENVAYHLTAAHVAGLRRYLALAAEEGLLGSAALPPLIELVSA